MTERDVTAPGAAGSGATGEGAAGAGLTGEGAAGSGATGEGAAGAGLTGEGAAGAGLTGEGAAGPDVTGADPARSDAVGPDVAVPESVGLPFASGREADVYALGDGRVLRRYRHGGDAAPEAAVMAYAGKHGFPVPEVFRAGGADLVMERLDGPTLAQALLAGDLTVDRGATILADLLRQLHDLPPMRDGETLVHLDVHPENVVLSQRGPVLIDWRNAGDGPADLDTALAALILAQVAVGAIDHELGSHAGELLDLFLERASGDPVRLLPEAVEIRRGQPTMSPEEIEQLSVAAARVRGVK